MKESLIVDVFDKLLTHLWVMNEKCNLGTDLDSVVFHWSAFLRVWISVKNFQQLENIMVEAEETRIEDIFHSKVIIHRNVFQVLWVDYCFNIFLSKLYCWGQWSKKFICIYWEFIENRLQQTILFQIYYFIVFNQYSHLRLF